MVFDPARLLALPPRESRASYEARDVIVYALGLGVGLEAETDATSPSFAYEVGLQVLPTMASVLASPGFWLREPQYGVDWKRVLHGEQSIEVHAPLAASGEVISQLTIEDILDKGAEKGAVMYTRRQLSDAVTQQPIATERRTVILKGDGGKGGGKAVGQPSAPSIPDRAPDHSVALPTAANQALLYRLSGDPNPLHVDPAIAAAAGFSAPILHGLCTYGIAGRALLAALCDNNVASFKRMDCRFSAPVYPGDTIVTDIWVTGDRTAVFRARVPSRNVVVLNNGQFEYVS